MPSATMLEAVTNPTPSPMEAATVDSVLERAVCFKPVFGRWGTSRKLPKSLFSTPADDAWVNAQKKLIGDCPEYEAILAGDRAIRNYLYSLSLPSPFGYGVMVLPLDLLEDVYSKLTEYQVERAENVSLFMTVYAEAVQAAKYALGPAFDAGNYPSEDEVRALFQFSWSFVTLATPEALPDSLFRAEKEKARKAWADTMGEMRNVLRVAMADLIDSMVDNLSGGKDGQPKKFHKTLVPNLNAFLDTFDARNLTNDADLEKLVGQARQMVEGVTVESLKADVNVRERVTAAFTEMKTAMAGMTVDRPKRGRMTLSSDDDLSVGVKKDGGV